MLRRDPCVLLIDGLEFGLLDTLGAPAIQIVLELLAGSRRVALPLEKAITELDHGGIELVAECRGGALELVQLVGRPVRSDVGAADRQQPHLDVGLSDHSVGEHLLLRRERVPHRRLGRGVDEGGDGRRLRLAVALRDDPLDRATRDPSGEQARGEYGDEQEGGREDRRLGIARRDP